MTEDPASRGRARPVDRAPVRLSHTVAVLASLGAASVAGWYSSEALLVGVGGSFALILGLYLRNRGVVLVGTLVLFVGVLVAGTADSPVAAVLIGVACVTVAWDAGDNAISLGVQVGRRSRSIRAQLVHLAGTLCVVCLTAIGGYGVYSVATGGHPVSALLALLLAGALLVAALSE